MELGTEFCSDNPLLSAPAYIPFRGCLQDGHFKRFKRGAHTTLEKTGVGIADIEVAPRHQNRIETKKSPIGSKV